MRPAWLAAALLLIISPAWADPPEGKGKGNAPGQQNPGNNGNNGNGNAGNNGGGNANSNAGGNSGGNARSAAGGNADRGNSVADSARAERTHVHAERVPDQSADRSDVGRPSVTGHARRDERRATDHGTPEHAVRLVTALNALEHARWSYNPHDTRGQGNLGRVDMQDPYGFDKDSGREGQDRGRPIRAAAEEPATPTTPPTPTLHLAELVSAQLIDPYINELESSIAWAESMLAWVSTSIYASQWSWYYSWLLSYYQNQLTQYLANPTSSSVYTSVLVYGDPVDYTLTVQPFEGMEGTTLQVTMQLISTENVTATGWTGEWEPISMTFESGQVVLEQTQEITLSADGTYALSFDPSQELLGGGYFNGSEGVTTDVLITVTDPVSGASYTMTMDQQLRLVDPYGLVYDKATGRPIANATVTVHHADGTIVALDSAGNAHLSNPQTTDATGRYSCKLVSGQYYLTVTAPGYEEFQSAPFSELGHVVRLDAGLTRVAAEPNAAALPEPRRLGGFVAPAPPAQSLRAK